MKVGICRNKKIILGNVRNMCKKVLIVCVSETMIGPKRRLITCIYSILTNNLICQCVGGLMIAVVCYLSKDRKREKICSYQKVNN